MRRWLWVVLLVFWVSFQGKAQQPVENHKIDSLEKTLQQVDDEVRQALLLQELSSEWLWADTAGTTARQYAEKILSLDSRQPSLTEGIGYYQLGNVAWDLEGLDRADEYYKKAIDFLSKDSSRTAKQFLARTWHNFGLSQQYKGNNEAFLEVLLNNSIPILEEIKDTLLLAGQYHSVGIVLGNIQQYEKSNGYYLKTIALLQGQKESEVLSDSYIYLAKNMTYMEDHEKGEVSKISVYLDRAYTILTDLPDSSSWIDYYIWNGVYLQYFKKDLSQALENYNRGLEKIRTGEDTFRIPELLNRKYYLYYESGQYEKAREVALEQWEIVSQQPIAKNRLLNLRHLINVEEQLGNIPRAHELLNQWVDLNDSLEQSETNLRIIALEKKYDQEKQQRQILQLQDEANQKEIKLQRSRIWIYSAGGLSLLLLLLVIGGYQIFRNRQQIAFQKEQLHVQEKEQLRQEQQLSNYTAMLEGQNVERKRIARELHDSVGGALAGIRLKLSQIPSQPEYQKENNRVLGQIDSSMDELRRIARNLMPDNLLRYDLFTAVEEFCRSQENKHTAIVFQALGDRDTPIGPTAKLALYRMIQESVGNALKHAQAKRILVQITRDEKITDITVEDDGSGFDTGLLTSTNGLGYKTLCGRVNELQGKLEIDSAIAVGTSVYIQLDNKHLQV